MVTPGLRGEQFCELSFIVSGMASWGQDEVLKLIAIWADDRVQAQLEDCHRNRDVFERVAKLLREEAYERTFEQCHEKIKKLKGDYRKVKDKQGKTGEGRKDWEYFDVLDAVLGHKPATQPHIVVDILADTADTDDEEDCETKSPTERCISPLESTDSSTPKRECSSTPVTGKKRKRSKTDSFEKIVECMVDKLVQAQSSSEARLLEFEEKRMRMEERQKERELEQTLVEKREQRSFQLAMMQMLTGSRGIGSQAAAPSYPPFPFYQPFEDDEPK